MLSKKIMMEMGSRWKWDTENWGNFAEAEGIDKLKIDLAVAQHKTNKKIPRYAFHLGRNESCN